MNENPRKGIEEFIFEYSLFLLTSARGTVDEPRLYGALRLVDGISRLTDLYSRSAELKQDEFLMGIRAEIETHLNNAMTSDEQFIRFMDDLIVKFTDEMKRRYARPEKWS